MKTWLRWPVRLLPALFAVALVATFFIPRPVPVDLGTVTRGPLSVTVEEEGETRVREIYLVSAPFSGRVLRFEGEVGDSVVAGETILVRIVPSAPTFLDRRTRTELEASVEAAEAALSVAEAEVARAEAEFDYAQAELQRSQELFVRGTIAEAAMDRALREARTSEAVLLEAEAALRMRAFELETARAALIDPSAKEAGGWAADGSEPTCCLDLRATVDGRVLQIFQESEATVTAGTALVALGDPRDLEVTADLLSQDAVAVSEGDAVEILRWGGEGSLNGVVERVEPYGFTKVSSLGIEEQRVNVIIRLTDPHARWERLGHGYRVDVRIVLRHEADALRIPSSALFRVGTDWHVFHALDGRAVSTRIEIGADTGLMAEVLSGLEAGDTVVLHPSEQVEDGVRLTGR